MDPQRGNIIVYLLVGLAFFGLMTAGIWWVKNRPHDISVIAGLAQQAPAAAPDAKTGNTPPPSQTDTPEPETKPDSTARQQPQNQPNSGSAVPGGQGAPGSAPRSAPSPAPQASAPATGPSAAMPPEDDAEPRPESQTRHTSSPDAVASSGPLEDAATAAMLLGAVTFLVHSFVRSRRLGRSL